MGRVVYAIPDLDQPGARMVERWLPAQYLSADPRHDPEPLGTTSARQAR